MAKDNENKSGNIAAGIKGAVIGAGIAAAATKLITDKKAQKAMKDRATDIKDKVTDSIKTVQKEARKHSK